MLNRGRVLRSGVWNMPGVIGGVGVLAAGLNRNRVGRFQPEEMEAEPSAAVPGVKSPLCGRGGPGVANVGGGGGGAVRLMEGERISPSLASSLEKTSSSSFSPSSTSPRPGANGEELFGLRGVTSLTSEAQIMSDPGDGDEGRRDGDRGAAIGVEAPGGDEVIVEIESSRRKVGCLFDGDDDDDEGDGDGDIRRRLLQ